MKTIRIVTLIIFIIPFIFSCSGQTFEGKWKCINAFYSIDQEKFDRIVQMDEELKDIFDEGMQDIDDKIEILKEYRLEFLNKIQALETDPETNEKYNSTYSIKDSKHIQIGQVLYTYKWIDKNHFNLTQSVLDDSFSITMEMERELR